MWFQNGLLVKKLTTYVETNSELTENLIRQKCQIDQLENERKNDTMDAKSLKFLTESLNSIGEPDLPQFLKKISANEQFKSEIDELNRENKNLLNSIEDLNDTIKRKNSQIIESTNEFNEVNTEIVTLKSKNVELKLKCEFYENQMTIREQYINE